MTQNHLEHEELIGKSNYEYLQRRLLQECGVRINMYKNVRGVVVRFRKDTEDASIQLTFAEIESCLDTEEPSNDLKRRLDTVLSYLNSKS